MSVRRTLSDTPLRYQSLERRVWTERHVRSSREAPYFMPLLGPVQRLLSGVLSLAGDEGGTPGKVTLTFSLQTGRQDASRVGGKSRWKYDFFFFSFPL